MINPSNDLFTWRRIRIRHSFNFWARFCSVLPSNCTVFCLLQLSVKNCFIRGSVVRYVQLPADEVDTQLLQDAARKEAMQQKQWWGRRVGWGEGLVMGRGIWDATTLRFVMTLFKDGSLIYFNNKKMTFFSFLVHSWLWKFAERGWLSRTRRMFSSLHLILLVSSNNRGPCLCWRFWFKIIKIVLCLVVFLQIRLQYFNPYFIFFVKKFSCLFASTCRFLFFFLLFLEKYFGVSTSTMTVEEVIL